MKICIVTPAGPKLRNGNRVTAARWSRFLRQLGHEVLLEESWGGEEPDLMISLHARRSHPSIRRYAATCPGRPLIVALTGTDLYRDIRSDEAARESLELATALIVLQEKAPEELESRHRAKTRVIYQSAKPVKRQPPAKRYFDVCVIGHLRDEKDPFRAALAARLLPPTSRVRVTHTGMPYDEKLAERARLEVSENPRYRWLGETPRWKARRVLARSRLLAQTSVMEGGANVVSEALVSRVPVVASDIPGNVGMLGENYPGYYPVGDEEALARLLYRAETDGAFHEKLEAGCEARRHLVLPEREKAILGSLVVEVVEAGSGEDRGLYLAHGRKDAHKADEVLAEGRLSF
ncbi:MAG: TIGR04348 family glycosyltransferase [Actinobacteria bacterium]|nr:TIGR04348 family glycosyltransferase [Actinomycetota bacterium]